MINVLLASPDDTFANSVETAIGTALTRLSLDELPADAGALLQSVRRPDIVILDGMGDDDAALALAAELSDQGIAPILVSDRASELGFLALRSGVKDLLARDAPPMEIREALDRAARAMPASPESPEVREHSGRVLSVISPKGGVGKTTVATNLAIGLATARRSTVLVDLDIHFGDVASALNLTPEFSLPDVASGPASRDSIVVKSYLTQHQTGLYVIPGSESPVAADAISAEDITRLLRLLKSQFEFVVVDTAPGLAEHTLAALDETDGLVMVTSLDVPGVRGLRKEIDTLSELQLTGATRQIVLNFFDANRGLSVADVEATIRAQVDLVLPITNSVPLSVNQGVPLLQSGGRDPVTQKLRRLVDMVAPTDVPARRGLLGRRAK